MKNCLTCGKEIPTSLPPTKYKRAKYCSRACCCRHARGDAATRFRLSYEERENGCWQWIGETRKFGYGSISYMGRGRLAHRVSWLLAGREIPDGLCVLHKCDNPGCVNPDHLFLGTKAENNQDKIRKGRARHPSGSEVSTAKLTEPQVRAILADQRTYRVIAGEFGVSCSAVSAIKNGQNWKKLATEFAMKSPDYLMKEAMKCPME